MSKLNEFIAYLKEQVGQPYVWGGQHTKLTPKDYISIIESKENKNSKPRGKYSDGTTYTEAAIDFCKKKFDSGVDVLYAYDCSGLGCYWLCNLQHLYKSDVNANTMMRRCVDLDTPEPPERGWWVFRCGDTGKATHIGYMIDNDYLIESKGRKYGVVKTKWKESDWTCWGIPKVFEDEIRNPELIEDVPPLEQPDAPIEQAVPAVVKVIGGSVNVRETDEMNDRGKPRGRILFTAHKGDVFPFIDASDNTGWYHIETKKGDGYITCRPLYTKLI